MSLFFPYPAIKGLIEVQGLFYSSSIIVLPLSSSAGWHIYIRPKTMTKMRNIFKTQLKFFGILLCVLCDTTMPLLFLSKDLTQTFFPKSLQHLSSRQDNLSASHFQPNRNFYQRIQPSNKYKSCRLTGIKFALGHETPSISNSMYFCRIPIVTLVKNPLTKQICLHKISLH